MALKDIIGTTSAGIGMITLILSSIVTGFFYIEDRFALAAEVEKLEHRVNINELQSLYKISLENLYFYRDQNRKYPDDLKLREKLKEAEDEVKNLKDLLNAARIKAVE